MFRFLLLLCWFVVSSVLATPILKPEHKTEKDGKWCSSSDQALKFNTIYVHNIGKDYWRSYGTNDLEARLALKENTNKAKNVILFIGDGMGVQTHTAARIYKGQTKGQTGEEEILAWEKFPYSGQSKTYNTDYQVADSAGTATALYSGVKTRLAVLGIDATHPFGTCDADLLEKSKFL